MSAWRGLPRARFRQSAMRQRSLMPASLAPSPDSCTSCCAARSSAVRRVLPAAQTNCASDSVRTSAMRAKRVAKPSPRTGKL